MEVEREDIPNVSFQENTKNNKDVSDLIKIVERISRQVPRSIHNYEELENKFKHQAYQLDEHKKENLRLNLLIGNKEKEINNLERTIVDKSLKLEQLIEEYNTLKSKLTTQIHELKAKIDIEQKNIMPYMNNMKMN